MSTESIILKRVDPLKFSKRKLQNMSGGQQRRASLAVALLHEPELLILDEPTVREILTQNLRNMFSALLFANLIAHA